MKTIKYKPYMILAIFIAIAFAASFAYAQEDDSTRQVLKQGLLGAGTGAIAAGASGGNAGKGALIGAGTGVIGSVLLDAITTPSQPRRVYRRSAPPPQPVQEDYSEDPGDEYDEYYEEPPQESSSSKVIKQGLLGAGTGAIAAGASGGNAGQGALIGAGTGVIGGALLDAVTTPSQPRRVYRRVQRPQQPPPQVVQQPSNVQVSEEAATSDEGRKRIIKKYDANGKLVSEEEVYY